MRKRKEPIGLQQAILLAESKQALQLTMLKEQMHMVYESLQPINLLKKTLQEVSASPQIKDTLLNNAIGISTGYLSKKILFGFSHNPLKKLAGTFLQFAIANVVSSNSNGIKMAAGHLLNRVLHMSATKKQKLQDEWE